jgi:hypothetical protein
MCQHNNQATNGGKAMESSMTAKTQKNNNSTKKDNPPFVIADDPDNCIAS